MRFYQRELGALWKVNAIMKLFLGSILLWHTIIKRRNNKVVFLGDRAPLPQNIRLRWPILRKKTKTTLDGAECGHQLRRPAGDSPCRPGGRQVQQGMLQPGEIDEARFSARLYTAGQKDPDFILRPSGETAFINFMLWQASYTELSAWMCCGQILPGRTLDKAIEGIQPPQPTVRRAVGRGECV